MELYSNERLINYLLLNSSYLNNVSLYHGKMGIVLSLLLYGEKYSNNTIKFFSYELLQEIYDQIHDGMPINIENGLAGIGLGITLLHKAKFVESDLNDVLSDIDNKIMSYDPRRITDFSYREGALGIVSYINARKSLGGNLLSFDRQYIYELSEILRKNEINQVNDFYFINDIKRPDWNEGEYLDKKLGIDGGSAYYIINDTYDQILCDK